jgi:2-polyprenyl-3-methyl-5-hydroxy-6-metoxy-1,4-benzoquinol methylase
MVTDPFSGVVLLGESLPYLDHAEEELLSAVRDAGDRSSSSDELARKIVDWPTRYHLSRSRTNLLRPLRLEPGMRVLDAGAGTGILSRYLAEQGAEVFALEGNIQRARVAKARCEGLPGVTVACGPLQALEDADGFDLVLLCGVLEYAGSILGGAAGAPELLRAASRLVRPGGVLVVAIENQLGLKYLLGYPEDHLGRAFIGLEGYPIEPGVRTWARRPLGRLLADAGFGEQRWLYPFPDYKLPVVVLDDRLYDRPDVVRVVDQVVREPARDYAAAPVMRADARKVHRSFLEAGLGRDVANSFLVVASSDATAPDALLGADTLVWRYGEERRRLWLRATTVVDDGERLVAHQERLHPDEGVVEAGFVRQRVTAERPYRQGWTLEQHLLRAAEAEDHDAMRAVLQRWRAHLAELEVDRTDGTGSHPYLPGDATRLLPDTYVDVALDNFVDEDGTLHFIDDEWEVPEGVDVRLAVARALWWLARSLVSSGTEHPWSASISIDHLAIALAGWCGETLDRDLLERMRAAEADFQSVVNGSDRDAVLAELVELGSVDRIQLGLRGHQTEGALGRMERELRVLQGDLAAVADRQAELDEVHAELESHQRLVRELGGQLAAVTGERNALAAIVTRIHSRLPMRMYLKAKRLVGRG